MTVLFYLVMLIMVLVVMRLTRVQDVFSGLRELSLLALTLLVMMVMLDAHMSAVVFFVIYGAGLLLMSMLVLLLLNQFHPALLLVLADDSLDRGSQPSSQMRGWVMPWVVSGMLLAVMVYIISQTTGKFDAHTITAKMVGTSLAQQYVVVCVVGMFWFVMTVALLVQMYMIPDSLAVRYSGHDVKSTDVCHDEIQKEA